MLRYKTETRPGLVALYDIRPGNGAVLFLQLRSPHGASEHGMLPMVSYYCAIVTLSVRRTVFLDIRLQKVVTLKTG